MSHAPVGNGQQTDTGQRRVEVTFNVDPVSVNVHIRTPIEEFLRGTVADLLYFDNTPTSISSAACRTHGEVEVGERWRYGSTHWVIVTWPEFPGVRVRRV